ncbi:amidohydrolase family protein, partial [Microbacterium maritypicum]|uniref:amidohydrolase family protein n=2 Tax=Microbacterium TaxID=33882 RepID=UPI00296F73AF
RRRWLGLLEDELGAGALGIGVLMGYAPRSDPDEYLDLARLAAAAHAPTFTHVRELIEADPRTPIDGSEELVRAAAETGAAMHHCHVNSTSLRHVDRVLGLLDRSRAAGSRVTVEAYPYGAGSTAIGAFFLAPEKLPGLGITPRSLVLVDTGERIADEARLREVRATDPGATCIVTFLDEGDPFDRAHLHRALAYPDSIVASDAMPISWNASGGRTVYEQRDWPLPAGGHTHPRTAGTFAKSLRLMVLESGTWSWLEAFRRCSFLPARVLDEVSSGMRGKGHLAVGADADIVVIDPTTLTDRASYADPIRPSRGVRELYVRGTRVVHEGEIVTAALPGRAVRGDAA